MADRSVAGINATQNRFELLTESTSKTTKPNPEGINYGPPLEKKGNNNRHVGKQSKIADYVINLAKK